MKRLIWFLIPIVITISCTSQKATPDPDPADAFVGGYSYTDNYFFTWGVSSGSLSSDGKFFLAKLSENQVKMSGAWNSIGEVVGNTVSFSDDMQSDETGYITYSFGVGTLYGNSIVFNYTGTTLGLVV